MFKTLSVDNPIGSRWFFGRKMPNAPLHYRMIPDIALGDFSKVRYDKDIPEGPRQRWVKRRTISKRQARFLKAQIRVSVSF